MNISELKQLAPLSDVYELDSSKRHIIFANDYVGEEVLTKLAQELNAVVFVFGQVMERPQIFELPMLKTEGK